ncbi:MAG: hypothetical protein ACYC7E_02115 [Armatimonadota bacterium]
MMSKCWPVLILLFLTHQTCSLSQEKPQAYTASQLAETATIEGAGDLLLFSPREGQIAKATGPLLSFAPLSCADELRIPITVTQDGYYDILLRQVKNPRFGGYVLTIDEVRLPVAIYLRLKDITLYDRRWGQVRLRPGTHILRFRKTGNDYVPVHPLIIDRLWLQAGSAWSFYQEAEWLPVVNGDAECYRPALGERELSGYAEFIFPAKQPGEMVMLALPAVPAGATHLVVALVGGPGRGIASLELDNAKDASPISTYATTSGLVTRLAILPLRGPAQAAHTLTLRCAGKDARSTGATLGIDGVAYGVDYTIEAEWLLWQGPWAMGRVPYSTGSGRSCDRGYIGADCNDIAKPAETVLDLPWTGKYRLETRVARAADQGKLQVQFDANPLSPIIDTNEKRQRWPEEWIACCDVTLTPGKHSLRIWNRDTDPAHKRIRFDAFRFVPLP